MQFYLVTNCPQLLLEVSYLLFGLHTFIILWHIFYLESIYGPVRYHEAPQNTSKIHPKPMQRYMYLYNCKITMSKHVYIADNLAICTTEIGEPVFKLSICTMYMCVIFHFFKIEKWWSYFVRYFWFSEFYTLNVIYLNNCRLNFSPVYNIKNRSKIKNLGDTSHI